MVNVLYCGMADDILTPLNLIPNLERLYVMDIFDPAFSCDGTRESQQKDIKTALTDGNDFKTHHYSVMEHFNVDRVYKIGEPCTILNEQSGNPWKLTFLYKGIQRELIYYGENYLQEWPKEIKNVQHIMAIGAEFPLNDLILIKMFTERTTPDCQLYTPIQGFLFDGQVPQCLKQSKFKLGRNGKIYMARLTDVLQDIKESWKVRTKTNKKGIK